MTTELESGEWKKTACILCAVNCGLEVQTSGGHITHIRGDKANPVSQGYICEKSQRMDCYQNSADRIDWDTALHEIAARLADIRNRHGGESIFFYGGGSQGNHLGGTYADGSVERRGVEVNELTDVNDRDPIAGTPWHKHVPVRIERLQAQRVAA